MDVVRQHPDAFCIEVLTAQNQADLLIRQALEFKPNIVVIGNETHYEKVRDALAHTDTKVFAGAGSIADAATCESVDTVVTALLGYAGLQPTMKAIQAGKHIALANKETLVAGGAIVCRAAREQQVAITPIDSEHSAIFQCLAGEYMNPVERIFLTGSGGPFRGKKGEQLQDIKPEQALKHPTWHMGRKISIDSATLMNKGLEMIEARWLFGVKPQDIEVVIHPESIVHSMVSFQDGAVIGQMSLPDMRLPIQYALTYPERMPLDIPRLDFYKLGGFTFSEPDLAKFPCLGLAIDAMKKGGNTPCALNAANETAVAAFMNEEIRFTDIPAVVSRAVDKCSFIKEPDLSAILETDRSVREIAANIIAKR